jgi:hypothetical protein
MGSPVVQFLNQYSFLFLMALILIGGTLFLRRKQASRRWWGVWGAFALANVGVVAMLPTAAARLSGREVAPLASQAAGSSPINDAVPEEFIANLPSYPESVADIEAMLATAERPTLVEFYSDFGLG